MRLFLLVLVLFVWGIFFGNWSVLCFCLVCIVGLVGGVVGWG